MTERVNIRELALETLLAVGRDGEKSHQVIRNVLEKYQYLPRQERAFFTRLCEGTLEYRIRLDYILDAFSRTPAAGMKPVIREILRMGVYQLRYMDAVPDSAAVNEAVKLAARKGFRNLKGFVNGVLRSVARNPGLPADPGEEQLVRRLSVRYSMPEFLTEKWLEELGRDTAEKMMAAFLKEAPLTARLRGTEEQRKKTLEELAGQGVSAVPAPYARNAFYLEGYDYDIVDGEVVFDSTLFDPPVTDPFMPGKSTVLKNSPAIDTMQPYLDIKEGKTAESSAQIRAAATFEQAPDTAEGYVIAGEHRDELISNLFNGEPTETMKKNWEQLQTMEKQTYTNIIYGNEPIEAFDTFVEEWKAQGGDQITEEVNAWYETVK